MILTKNKLPELISLGIDNLKCLFKLPLQIINELSNPAIMLIVFLAVADEDEVIVTGNEAGHLSCSL